MGFSEKFYLFVADLDDAAAEDPSFTEIVDSYNPGREPPKPVAYVGYTITSHPTVRFANGDFSDSGVRILRRHGQGIRRDDDLIGSRRNRLGILRLRDRAVARLRGRGWTVMNAPPEADHYVYVFRIEDGAPLSERVQRENPDADPDMPVVYVGQSSHPPAERLERHLAGERANRYVRDHFLHELPALYEPPNPLTERESLEKEEALARELRACGYTVIWG